MWLRLGFLIGLIGLFLLITITAYELNFNEKIIPRVYIAEFELTGMGRDEAVSFLSLKYDNSPKELILFGNMGEQRVSFEDLGVEYLYDKTVKEAWLFGRKSDLWRNYKEKFLVLRDGVKLEFIFDYDSVALDGLVASVAAEINNKPIEPKIEINKQNEIVFVQGRNGEEVENEELERKMLNSIRNFDFETIRIPTKRIVVEKTDEEIEILKERATKLLGQELKLVADGYTKKVQGKELVSFVGFDQKWNKKNLTALVTKIGSELNREAQDARFEFKNERLADFSPDIDGLEVQEEALIDEIIRSLEMNREKVEIPIKKTMAKIRAGEINNLGIKELLGEGRSTYLNSIPGRVHNVSLASSRINGVMVPPGEVFSFNKTLGDISAATGYKSAYIIKAGRTVLGDGGGVCQVSTTLFRAALNAGLPIVERHPHAYRVSYYEQDSKPGLDATVYDPTADLKFRNDTDKHILIQTKVDPIKYRLEIEIYGTSDGRVATVTTPKIFSTTPPPEDLYIDDPTMPNGSIKQIDWKAAGARVAFDYLVERNGEVIYKKTFYSNYQPWQAVYLRGVGG